MAATLNEEFQRISNSHSGALKKTVARVVLGSSVIRVFAKDTKATLLPVLEELNVDVIAQFDSQTQFSKWFDKQVRRIANTLAKHHKKNASMGAGLVWGHSTKIMALYARDLVLSSRYFSDAEAKRISPFLHVPIDSIVIKRLRHLGIRVPFTKIKEIDTREKFYDVQDALASAALVYGIPRVWFDDNWGDRQ